MITIEEIRNEVENLTEILKNVKTLEDCRNLRRYGYKEEFIFMTINGEDWNLKDAMFEMAYWDKIKVQAVGFSDYDTKSGISNIYLDKNGKVTFDVVDDEYDEEYTMLEDCTLDTLEADYNRAIYEAVCEDRFID